MKNLIALFFSLSLPVLGTETLPIPVNHLDVRKGMVELKFALPETQNAPKFFLEKEGGENLSLGSAVIEALNLWVMVDVSALCRGKDVDLQLNQLLSRLKVKANKETLLSLVSYTDSSLEIHYNHKPIRSIENFSILCQPQSRSASHEKAVRHLMRAKEMTDLSTMVWVFSSGNVKISAETLEAMRRKNIDTRVAVYNTAVKNEVIPILAGQRAVLTEDHYSFGFNDKQIEMPEVRYTLSFYPPFAIQGKKVTARLLAEAGEMKFASDPFKLNLPDSKLKLFWLRYGRYLALAALLGLLIKLGIALVRYYLPRHCAKCERRLRVSDKRCPFCREEGDAFLIGSFNHKDKEKAGKRDVLPVLKSRLELGTHRKSAVRFLRPKGMKRRSLAILYEENTGDKKLYRLERTRLADENVVRVNDERLVSARYLKSGDKINILDQEIGFYVEAVS